MPTKGMFAITRLDLFSKVLNNCKTLETFFVLKVSKVLLRRYERPDY